LNTVCPIAVPTVVAVAHDASTENCSPVESTALGES
jgi:hypothetical protein